MNSDTPEPAEQRNEAGGPPPTTPLQRVIAGIALIALIASAAITSWWILSGQVDFTKGPQNATPDAEVEPIEAAEPRL